MTKNPFDVFTTETKTAEVPVIGKIEYRTLTMAESDGFNKRLLKDYDGRGDTPTIDLAEATQINYEKVALALISPKVTVEKLQSLSVEATKTIGEIVKLIEGKQDEVDAEGNSKN